MIIKTVIVRVAVAALTLVNSVAIATGISGETFKTLQAGDVDWKRFIPLVIFVLLVQFLVYWVAGRSAEHVRLREGSERFARFFSSWYGTDGSISVYCSDLEWLEGPLNAPIVEKLQKKGQNGRATVFIRQYASPVVRQLLTARVDIYLIPEEVKLRSRLSVREDDDSTRLIIRIKSDRPAGSDNAKVAVVRDTNDQYWCNLAQETLALCRRGRRIRLTGDGQIEVAPA